LLDLLSVKAQAVTLNGDFKTALAIYQDLLAKANEVGDQVQKARAQKGIATMLMNQDDLSNALPPMYESYAIYNSINKTLEAGYSLIAFADILCQLGRYEEATAALNQAKGIAEKYEPLKPRVNLVLAKKSLSEGHLGEAVNIAQQIIAGDPKLKRASTIEAKSLLALALVKSGEKLRAKKFIEEIDLKNIKMDEAEAAAKIYLIMAEIMLGNNLPELALENAQKAQASFNKLGKPSFEWLAWSVICSAQKNLGNNIEASQASAKADIFFSTLSQNWEKKDFNSYSERPDVKFYRSRLLKTSS
jgi:tetratricopeptide (TPR) repeat protein